MGPTILKLLLSWGAIIAPTVLVQLQGWQAAHPNPLLALALQLLGAGVLQVHGQDKK